jgi:hypothetical protein
MLTLSVTPCRLSAANSLLAEHSRSRSVAEASLQTQQHPHPSILLISKPCRLHKTLHFMPGFLAKNRQAFEGDPQPHEALYPLVLFINGFNI